MKQLEHWLMEGDNLDGLQALMPELEGRVDVIYIDPPYNTRHRGLTYNDRLNDWSTMMLPRLQLARRLLSEKGVMVVSIDQHELFQLGALMNETFGQENCLGVVTLVNNMKGRSDGRHFAVCNEFMLFYALHPELVRMNLTDIDEEEQNEDYSLADERSSYKMTGFRKTGKAWRREERPLMYYPVLRRNGEFFSISKKEFSGIYRKGTFDDAFVEELCQRYRSEGYEVFLPLDRRGEKGRWRWGFSDTFRRAYKTELCVNSSGKLCVKMRNRLEDGSLRGKLAKTTWYKAEYDTGMATRQLTELMGGKHVFDNPKSVEHIKDVLRLFSHDALILDFFAGSGTTMHATLALNEEDGGNRRCIIITNNENDICQRVTRERCRRIMEGYQQADGTHIKGYAGNTLRYIDLSKEQNRPQFNNF
jgi:adenine-specific DNA-methyltransferase